MTKSELIRYAVGKILGFAIANFVWQLVTGGYNWEFAASISFFQAWAIGFTVKDWYKESKK
jgi:hypothetical protein